MNLTVACVFVRGHVPFSVEYVTRLQAMAARHLPPHRFVCLTDRPLTVPVETIAIPTPRGMFGWWGKVELFNPAHKLDGRILYLDLDVLLVNDLRPIVEFPAPFALAPCGAPNFRPKKFKTVKRFNSSVMAWNSGEQAHLWTGWTPGVAGLLWGDQDWIGAMCPDAATMPAAWFPRLSAAKPPWPAAAKVILCKRPKNADAARKWPWFEKAWA